MKSAIFYAMILVAFFVVSLNVNAQAGNQNCGSYQYDSFQGGCSLAVWIPYVSVDAQGHYKTHLEFPNYNGKHEINIAEVRFFNTNRNGLVGQGIVWGSYNGSSSRQMGHPGLGTVVVGGKAIMDIEKTSCDTGNTLDCPVPPAEMNVSLRVQYIVDPANISDLDTLSMPFATITDKVGDVTWSYGYPAKARPSYVLLSQAVLGGGSSCAVGVQNQSARDNYVVAILLDGDDNSIETQDLGLLLPLQNSGVDCGILFPKEVGQADAVTYQLKLVSSDTLPQEGIGGIVIQTVNIGKSRFTLSPTVQSVIQ